MADGRPGWQCVLMCWGRKYPPYAINHLIDAVSRQAAEPPRFVLVTDMPPQGLREGVIVRPFPPFFQQDLLRQSGCQAKLAMFESGVVPADLPAVYVDLDTVILGDLGRGIGLMRDARTILMLPSVALPFGWPGRLVHRLTGGRRYARGNSSVVVFHPAECADVALRFRRLFSTHSDLGFRPLIADERFLSWAAQDRILALPSWFAVKFPVEFMFPWRPWLRFRAALPWVQRRRAGLVAVTLCGDQVKPATLRDGDRVNDAQGHILIWTDALIGPMRARIMACCAAMV